jgi:hypothetical protein
MSTTSHSRSGVPESLRKRRGGLVQIGAVMPAVLERYELRFPSPAPAAPRANLSRPDAISSDETTSIPPADGLRCV